MAFRTPIVPRTSFHNVGPDAFDRIKAAFERANTMPKKSTSDRTNRAIARAKAAGALSASCFFVRFANTPHNRNEIRVAINEAIEAADGVNGNVLFGVEDRNNLNGALMALDDQDRIEAEKPAAESGTMVLDLGQGPGPAPVAQAASAGEQNSVEGVEQQVGDGSPVTEGGEDGDANNQGDQKAEGAGDEPAADAIDPATLPQPPAGEPARV
jgi:hypothetical protein